MSFWILRSFKYRTLSSLCGLSCDIVLSESGIIQRLPLEISTIELSVNVPAQFLSDHGEGYGFGIGAVRFT
jgi:hypothetical protein